jgi:ribonuclease HI
MDTTQSRTQIEDRWHKKKWQNQRNPDIFQQQTWQNNDELVKSTEPPKQTPIPYNAQDNVSNDELISERNCLYTFSFSVTITESQ